MSSLKQLVIIAGAGPGIGQAVGRIFAKHHYGVALLSRNESSLKGIADEINAQEDGGRAQGFVCDVTDSTSVSDCFAMIKSAFADHQLKVAVFNANSPFIVKPFLDLSLDDVKASVDVNCMGAFHFAQASLPMMLDDGGTLILTGATASLKGSARFAAFAPGKFALRGLAQSLAREFSPCGIHVAHTIVDGLVDTPRVRNLMGQANEGSRLDPASIADACYFLSQQPKNCWVHEMDLRPFGERW